MPERPPLLFRVEFGRLAPANTAAVEAVKALPPGQCRIEIKRSGANDRRRAYYWVLLDVAAEALTDATDSPWDAETLHDVLRTKLRLGTPLLNKRGEEVGFKLQSTSNRAMTEPERVRWLDRVSHVLGTWIGVEPSALMDEARRRGGQHEVLRDQLTRSLQES